jgi:hypothetical protein
MNMTVDEAYKSVEQLTFEEVKVLFPDVVPLHNTLTSPITARLVFGLHEEDLVAFVVKENGDIIGESAWLWNQEAKVWAFPGIGWYKDERS